MATMTETVTATGAAHSLETTGIAEEPLLLEGDVWAKGALELNVATVTEAILELARRLGREAHSRKILEERFKVLEARGLVDPAANTGGEGSPGEDGGGGGGLDGGGGSKAAPTLPGLQNSVRRVERELGFFKAEQDLKAKAAEELLALQVDALRKEMAGLARQAQSSEADRVAALLDSAREAAAAEASKAAQACLAEEAQKLQSGLANLSANLEERLRLFEQRLAALADTANEALDAATGAAAAIEGAMEDGDEKKGRPNSPGSTASPASGVSTMDQGTEGFLSMPASRRGSMPDGQAYALTSWVEAQLAAIRAELQRPPISENPTPDQLKDEILSLLEERMKALQDSLGAAPGAEGADAAGSPASDESVAKLQADLSQVQEQLQQIQKQLEASGVQAGDGLSSSLAEPGAGSDLQAQLEQLREGLQSQLDALARQLEAQGQKAGATGAADGPSASASADTGDVDGKLKLLREELEAWVVMQLRELRSTLEQLQGLAGGETIIQGDGTSGQQVADVQVRLAALEKELERVSELTGAGEAGPWAPQQELLNLEVRIKALELESAQGQKSSSEPVQQPSASKGLARGSTPDEAMGLQLVTLREELQRLRDRMGGVEQRLRQAETPSGRSEDMSKLLSQLALQVRALQEASEKSKKEGAYDLDNFTKAIRGAQRQGDLNAGRLEDLAAAFGALRGQVEVALPQLLHALSQLARREHDGDGAASPMGPEALALYLAPVRELLFGETAGGSSPPFASVRALHEAVEGAEDDAQARIAQLRQELMRALSGKADGEDLRALTARLEGLVDHIRNLTARIFASISQSESVDNAAIFRLPMLPARCISCDRKVDLQIDRRSPWDRHETSGSPWPQRATSSHKHKRDSPLPMIDRDSPIH